MTISQQLTIGQRLLQERKKRSWSQQMLAEKLGTTVLNINRWEHDKTQPQPHHRETLCEVFGKSHDELFGIPPEEERVPLWNIPHLRNLYFTGREDILKRLHDAFTTTTKKAVAITQPHAISGLGGVGKTQVAIEYAYRYSDEYKALLWARADSHESLISELVHIAALLDLPEKNEADQNKVIAAVMRWLQKSKDWLLIFDNADDIEMISEFLPTRGAGHTLLTTRSQATGKNIKGIEIEKMGLEEGALLLLRRAKLLAEDATLDQASEIQRKDAKAICELMDGLPLALDQAAAYIEENECSLTDYLNLYQTRRATLLKRRGTFSKRDYPKSVATTWSLSFEQVQHDNPAAADLLRLFAFLHPDAIPEEMIIAGAPELGPTLHSVAEDPIQLAETIGELRKFSLVRRNPEAKTLSTHRLVQMVLRDGMEKEMQGKWAERSVRVVNRMFPSPQEVEQWSKSQQYLPHALLCAELIEQWDMIFSEATQLLDKIGNYLRERGQYKEAEQFLQRLLAVRKQVLNTEHPDVATTFNDLAAVYYQECKFDQSELFYQQAITLFESVLGPEHPKLAESLHNLAALYNVQGKYVEAAPLYQRALTIRERVLGPVHPQIVRNLADLAWLYIEQGKYTEAESLSQRALLVAEKTRGPVHPDVAYSLNCLAFLYFYQGLYASAEPLLRRASEINEQLLGPTHPDFAGGLNNLAKIYQNLGKYAQAELIFQQALTILEQTWGSEHYDVAQVLHNLAELYRDQGLYTQAEPLYLRAIAICRKVMGPEHPNIVRYFSNLGRFYTAQGKYSKAESSFLQALAICEKHLEPDNPLVVRALENYAELLRKTNREVEALPLEERAKTFRAK